MLPLPQVELPYRFTADLDVDDIHELAVALAAGLAAIENPPA
jgi:hypothetical protein